MSGDTPAIVLNEFGDLSRKARRELEARGIDPDTAVIEYIAATGQVPVITPQEAAQARAQAQVEAAQARQEPVIPVDVPEDVAESTVPIERPAVEQEPTPFVPPVSVPVTNAETGPIEPLVIAPALDSGSLSAVEETLAAVSSETNVDQPGVEDAEDHRDEVPVAKRLSRREKRLQARNLREELKTASEAARIVTAPVEIVSAETVGEDLPVEPVVEVNIVEEAIIEEVSVEELPTEDAAVEVVEEITLDEHLTDEEIVFIDEHDEERAEITDADDYQPLPQTISEATAAIAIAEAVAAAEAVVDAGELSMDSGTMASAVPATTGSISVIPNALILPNLPETTGSIAPIAPTGEIVITGSILIPSSVSQTGTFNTLDTSEIDVISDNEPEVKTSGMAPVSAASAVSAYNISNNVVTTPRGLNERLPFILSMTAAGLAVGVVALFVAGYFLGLF